MYIIDNYIFFWYHSVTQRWLAKLATIDLTCNKSLFRLTLKCLIIAVYLLDFKWKTNHKAANI